MSDFTFKKTTPMIVFPFVSFTNTEGKKFCIPRERIIHIETYTKTVNGDDVLTDKTYVNFTSPNPKSKGSLYAVVDMPVEIFRDTVLKPAYETDMVDE